MKGIYILIIDLSKDSTILIGGLGKMRFQKGTYFYVGSAMNGIEARVRRHLQKNKKLFWHIDYLLKKASIVHVIKIPANNKKAECIMASHMLKLFKPIERFGSSDCSCASHLFYHEK
ncbi:MAG: GIY-YIG nuclease family protein [Spirochaetes bacterium]|nr:GIY-YIG nuclease family protein [Spirochaetota bacterium]